MHVFVAGATGTAGQRLIPLLIEHGHTVTGSTRSPAKADALRALGAAPVVMDGLDAASVRAAVVAARPDAVIHQMTALSTGMRRTFDRTFEQTNRLRSEGTEHLLAAAREAGVERFVAQSFAGWPSERTGGPVKRESDPLDPDPPRGLRESHAAIRRLESLVTAADGVVLRYGGFYGPGSGVAPGGEQVEMLRKRRVPLVGSGDAVWSFLHTDDLASATVAALERGTPGAIYNICDDDPAPVREWLPALARAAGAPAPRHVPAWLARLVGGPGAVVLMTTARGASNARAKAELGWTPAWPSWRAGFQSLGLDAGRARPRAAAEGAVSVRPSSAR